MEKYDNSRTNHFASLERLNTKILNIKGNEYCEKYFYNNELIQSIRNQEIYKKIHKLRDSKIAHIDNKGSINPFHFESFSEVEIKSLFSILEKIKEILNNFLAEYSGEYFIPNFSRTSNLLTYFEEYRAFAHSNPIEFLNWKNTIRDEQ